MFKAAQRRWVAGQLTVAVVLLNVGFYLTCLSPAPPLPGDLGLLQLLWASAHRPSFYLLLMMLTLGPALTLMAWQVRGRHRLYLAMVWGASVVLMTTVLGPRMGLMLRILWWRWHG